MKIEGFSELEKHISFVDGRMSSSEPVNGVYEVIATKEAMQKLDLLVGETYSIRENVFFPANTVREIFKVKLVGIFTVKDSQDPYWFENPSLLKESLVVDSSVFESRFFKMDPPLLTESKWFFALDYHKINISNIPHILKCFENDSKWIERNGALLSGRLPLVQVLEEYGDREIKLKMTLWILQIPILLMLAFYIFMVSQLIVDHEKNEIAVLKSRGASKLQVFFSYLIESGILSIAALILGPVVGLLLCNVVGAASGFLEFVQRAALPTVLGIPAYVYSIWAVLLFIITMMVPVILSSRTNIVQHKQKKARTSKLPFWNKYFIDIILLGISLYGKYRYNDLQKVLGKTGVKGSDLGMDPVLFISSTLFVIGAGLLFLRVFPFIIRFIFWLGRKVWSPVLYASFIQVGRSGGQEQFIMVFLILTLSIGIFSATAARTINKNVEEKVLYFTGADLTMKAVWEKVDPPSMDTGEGGETPTVTSTNKAINYNEPAFTPFTEISGLEEVTKVFIKNGTDVRIGTKWFNGNTTVMGIIPHEFGRAAWFRSGLLPSHWYNYLNLLSSDPGSLLVSEEFQITHKVKQGDRIAVKWQGQDSYLEGVVSGIVKYWPTFNPEAAKGSKTKPMLVVANLNNIHQNMRLEPYAVWAKREENATSEEIYKDIVDKEIKLEQITNSTQEIIKSKNDPIVQGTNGSLTLGFIVTMAISTVGFLIYWIISIRSRILQFGILRAMGLSLSKVIGMLVCEQIMISGTAVLMGIVIGRITCVQFVPMLQAVHSAEQQVPPFKITESVDDYIRIYAFVSVMLAAAIGFLGVFISKLKISQALKLGED